MKISSRAPYAQFHETGGSNIPPRPVAVHVRVKQQGPSAVEVGTFIHEQFEKHLNVIETDGVEVTNNNRRQLTMGNEDTRTASSLDAEEIWFYGQDGDEVWHGPRTRDGAIAEGREHYAERDFVTFQIATGRKPSPDEFAPEADDIIETMCVRASDNCGEIADDWPDVDAAGKAALTLLLRTWANENCPVSFWQIDGKQESITVDPTEGRES